MVCFCDGNTNKFEDSILEKFREIVSHKFANEGLTKDVIKLSQYLDIYIVSKQMLEKEKY